MLRIPPNERVASAVSEEARRIKHGTTRRHLESLCRYEEELFNRVDSDAVEDIYNRLGLQMPSPLSMPQPQPAKAMDEENSNDTGTVRKRDADYKTIQSARSIFHPVKDVREQALANLVLLDEQEMDRLKQYTADWGATITDCDIVGAAWRPP